MQLGLSSAAAPDLPLADLLEGCRRRGLAALELVVGDAHGIGPELEPVEAREALLQAKEYGVQIAALASTGSDPGCAERTVRLAARIGVPALLEATSFRPADLSRFVKQATEAGGRLLLRHGTDSGVASTLRSTVEALPAGAVALAWQVDPGSDDPAEVSAVLQASGSRLQYVRFRGGGPESVEQTGMGVGALMARLALARYAGPLVLTPTRLQYRYAWRAWLGRAGGWGCGSKQSDPSLVTLPLTAGT